MKDKRQMSIDEFETVCKRIKGQTKFIYLHVMGEPLLHPHLEAFLKTANEHSLPVCITTNGFLLKEKRKALLDNATSIHKTSISLHAPEGNDISEIDAYLENAISFAKEAASLGIFIVFRLWNEGGEKSSQNPHIEALLKKSFQEEWQKRPRGFRISQNTFLEYDGVFTWPSSSTAEEKETGFCHAISHQLAILSDGTVVPCCLDSNGDIELGNIFNQTLSDIIKSERTANMLSGFLTGKFVEPMCKKCTFARKFKPRHK